VGTKQGENYIFASISHSISETVHTSTKVTVECEYEVACTLLNGVIYNDLE